MTDLGTKTDELLRRAKAGDAAALSTLFARYRDRPRQMVHLRLDRRVYGRINPSNLLQEAYLDVARRFPEYAAVPAVPFYLWLRAHVLGIDTSTASKRYIRAIGRLEEILDRVPGFFH